MIANLTAIEVLAIARAAAGAKKFRDAVQPGTYQIDTVVHLTGEVRVGEDYEVAPTASIPLLPVLALLCQKLGARKREEILTIIMECMREALFADEEAHKVMVEAFPELKEHVQTLKALMQELPKVPEKGKVTGDVLAEGVRAKAAA